MKIKINGRETDTTAQTLEALAAELSLPEKGVAIAVASRMVPRNEWAQTALNADDNVLIIKAACGG